MATELPDFYENGTYVIKGRNFRSYPTAATYLVSVMGFDSSVTITKLIVIRVRFHMIRSSKAECLLIDNYDFIVYNLAGYKRRQL